MTRSPPVTPEGQFLAAVLALAHYHGWLAFHVYDSRRSIGHGFPDLVLLRAGRLIFTELKSPEGKLRPLQSVWLLALSSVPGVTVRLWRPKDWPEIVALLTSPVPLRVVPASAYLSFAS